QRAQDQTANRLPNQSPPAAPAVERADHRTLPSVAPTFAAAKQHRAKHFPEVARPERVAAVPPERTRQPQGYPASRCPREAEDLRALTPKNRRPLALGLDGFYSTPWNPWETSPASSRSMLSSYSGNPPMPSTPRRLSPSEA